MDRKQQMMTLWKSTFHDSDEFIHLYFARKYSPEHLRFHETAGKIVSAFLALPYTLNWLGKEFQTLYASGVCTTEEYRNRGLMSGLFQEALCGMQQNGIAFSTLIPAEEWLFGYYEKLGYATVFFYSTEKYYLSTESVVSPTTVVCPQAYDSDFAKRLFPYFNRKTRERSCSILHPLDDYETILEEYYLSGGRLAACFCPQSGKPTGWAMAQMADHHVRVQELFYDTPQEKQALLTHFAHLWQTPEVICKTIPQTGDSIPYGMIRITDVWGVLQHIARLQPDLSLSIQVSDMQIPENRGLYILSGGKCEKQSIENLQANLNVDINTLSRILFGQMDFFKQPTNDLLKANRPYMNLMID